MHYNDLKTLLKDVQRYKQRTKPPPATPKGLKRTLTMYRAFSGLIQRQPHNCINPNEQDIESQPILVNSVQQDGSESYQTAFLMAAEEGGEFELIFFKRIDDEFNKVDKFYRAKVEEVMKEATMLNKQMEALIAFRIKVEKPSQWFNSSVEMTHLASDVANSAATLSSSTPREAKLHAFVLSALALASVLANLDMEMDPKTEDYKAFTELIPLILVLILIAILSCPFNIMYGSSRLFFLSCVFHCICAPLYKVTLPDFFLADQFTSQVQALRSLEFYVCYYGWGDFKQRENTCNSNHIFRTFSFIVAVIPYWCRLLQCLRRLFEEKDAMQGYNALKYFLTIAAVCLRTAYSLYTGISWNVLAWFFSICAAIFSTYWDIVRDWGLHFRC